MARKTSKSKSQTVSEFKAWLEGLLEFQEDNWVPSPTQWKAIQDRIANLKDEVVVMHSPQQQVATTGYVQTNNAPVQQQSASPVVRRPPATLLDGASEPLGVGTIEGGTAITLLPTDDNTPPQRLEVAPMPSNLQPSIENVSSTVRVSGKKYRTPSDLSGKDYKSPFA